MQEVLLVAYLLIVLAMIGVILLQRSEGGGLGMGGGNTGLISVRGSANLLTRTTAILAALFFVTAIGLAILAKIDTGNSSIVDNAATATGESAEPTNVLDALNTLQPPTATTTDAPAASSAAPAVDPALALPAAPAPAEPASSAPAQ